MHDTTQRHLQKPAGNGNRGLLRKLRLSEGGNVMAMTAAAIVPLVGVIGGAVDISRVYLTKSRLQQACDAGALAGRKSMTDLNLTSDNEAKAKAFFSSNFPDGKYGTENLTVSYSSPSAGTVTGTAKVSVPMTLMALFGQSSREVSASCGADLQLPNTDVMLVLDTTLSMAEKNAGDSQTRIQALRDAVKNFHGTLESVRPNGSTIRYGFVPYSSTVNVGTLLKPEWIVDSAVYNSRVPDGTHAIPGTPESPTKSLPPHTEFKGTKNTVRQADGSSENCKAPANTYTIDSVSGPWLPSASSLPRTQTITRTFNGTAYTAALAGGVCRITATIYDNYQEIITFTVVENPDAGKPKPDGTAYHWVYKPVTYSMAPLKRTGANGDLVGGSFDAAVDIGHKGRKITWNQANACIEERATRRLGEGSNVPRHDMDVDLVPDANPATQWKPYLPGIVYAREASSPTNINRFLYTGSPATHTRSVNLTAPVNYYTPHSYPNEYGACPATARKLGQIDTSTLTTYLNSLTPVGYTYHDIGFVWGLRLMSPTGLFRNEHQAAESKGRIARHLILMTDGETETRVGAYDAWGISGMDRRRTSINAIPSETDRNAITEARLSELCTVAKNGMNITVWVIAFGDKATLSDMLVNCASSQNHAFKANNAAQLTATFAEIASQVAQLRITK